MPEALKNIYTPVFFEQFTTSVKKTIPDFNSKNFIKDIFTNEWKELELKQRMRHIAGILRRYLSCDYKDCINDVIKIVAQLQRDKVRGGFEHMFLPDLIEQYGLNDLSVSLKGMEAVTQFTSCEFAIRPFIKKYPEKVINQMLKWSKHSHHHVRRFASEGCRPRLPWAMALNDLKTDPSPILPILENLKNDSSEFVRRSVANNLNDIAKDNPHVVISIAKKWKGGTSETDWIIKHGCRTLLKKASPDIYKLFGLNSSANCCVDKLKLEKPQIKIGDKLKFEFELCVQSKSDVKLRLEYIVYYLKSNGKHNSKLFKITENNYKGHTNYSIIRSQSFADMTTRKHYPGLHKVGIVVNGKEMATKEFIVLK